MNILFVTSGVYFQEPIGVLQLSAIAKKRKHETDLAILGLHSLAGKVKENNPDIIAYSAMSADEEFFIKNDNLIRPYIKKLKKPVLRIMGGPHPTFFTGVLDKMDLDAICVGEGDYAFRTVLERAENGSDLSGIPNIMCRGDSEVEKSIVDNLDSLPFPDRILFYQARPHLRSIALRSFLTSRGCPFSCSYCFNHVYNKMFQGKGKILRRRSVDNVIEEIKYVIKYFPPVRFIKFADDTFVFSKSAWLEEFSEKYRKEINLPFYCLMRSNVLTDEVGRILSNAGCASIGMALEAGNEHIRNAILKRNLSDEVIIESFEIARKYGMSTYGGIIIGVPGSTIEDDFQSTLFAKKIKLTAPVFSICAPYPGTSLTSYAIEHGFLDSSYNRFPNCAEKTVFSGFSEEDKRIHQRLAYLGPIFCMIPFFSEQLLRFLSKCRLSLLYALVHSVLSSYIMSHRIVPGARPKNPLVLIRALYVYFKYWFQGHRSNA